MYRIWIKPTHNKQANHLALTLIKDLSKVPFILFFLRHVLYYFGFFRYSALFLARIYHPDCFVAKNLSL